MKFLNLKRDKLAEKKNLQDKIYHKMQVSFIFTVSCKLSCMRLKAVYLQWKTNRIWMTKSCCLQKLIKRSSYLQNQHLRRLTISINSFRKLYCQEPHLCYDTCSMKEKSFHQSLFLRVVFTLSSKATTFPLNVALLAKTEEDS